MSLHLPFSPYSQASLSLRDDSRTLISKGWVTCLKAPSGIDYYSPFVQCSSPEELTKRYKDNSLRGPEWFCARMGPLESGTLALEGGNMRRSVDFAVQEKRRLASKGMPMSSLQDYKFRNTSRTSDFVSYQPMLNVGSTLASHSILSSLLFCVVETGVVCVDLSSKKIQWERRNCHPSRILSLCVMPRSYLRTQDYIVTGGIDGNINVMNVTGQLIHKISAYGFPVNSLVAQEGADVLFASSREGIIKGFDIIDASLLFEFAAGNECSGLEMTKYSFDLFSL
jgi:WD40 repeat protein